MSVAASEIVWKHSKARLCSRMVLLAIADHVDDKKGGAWPSVARLADRCGLSEREVQRSLKELVALGEIAIHPNRGPNGVNFYVMRLVASATDELDPRPVVAPTSSHPDQLSPRPVVTTPPTTGRSTPDQLSPNPLGTVIEPLIPPVPELVLEIPEVQKPKPPPVFSPIQLRLNRLYNRRATTHWSDKEKKAWKALGGAVDEQDLESVERHYAAMAKTPDRDYRFGDLVTLLNNWQKAVDRARRHKPVECF